MMKDLPYWSFGSGETHVSKQMKHKARSILKNNMAIGNIVNDIVITVCGARWGLEIAEGALCKVCGSLTTMLYP